MICDIIFIFISLILLITFTIDNIIYAVLCMHAFTNIISFAIIIMQVFVGVVFYSHTSVIGHEVPCASTGSLHYSSQWSEAKFWPFFKSRQKGANWRSHAHQNQCICMLHQGLLA